jgi:small GTP-binding protein
VTEKLKICLIGATCVGKTSLMSRFVRSIFDEHYQTTIGVAIERRDLQRGDRTVQLVIWDMSGEDEFQNVQPAYLRGAAGYVLVVDGTRPDTIETARSLQKLAYDTVGPVPFVVAVNKVDLAETWELDRTDRERLARSGWTILYTSARTGVGVDELFSHLVDAIGAARERAWT